MLMRRSYSFILIYLLSASLASSVDRQEGLAQTPPVNVTQEDAKEVKGNQVVHEAKTKDGKLKVLNFNINQENYDEFNGFLKGRKALEVHDYKSAYMTRQMLELLVFQIAPVLGGCECEIQYSPASMSLTTSRPMYDVHAGHVLAHPVASYAEDTRVSNDMMLSDTVVDGKDFYVGLYTDESRADILGLTDIEKIKQLTVIVSRHWLVDIGVLKDLKLDYLLADNWWPALKMLKAGRGDVLMQPFSKELEKQIYDRSLGITLKPIPNVKVHFNRSRHYVISKNYTGSKAFLIALNKGIQILKDSGELTKISKAAGFMQEDVKNWRLID